MTMGMIALEGIHFFAPHGYYEEEQLIGNQFEVDIYVDLEFGLQSMEDALENTVNYESLFNVCREVFSGAPRKLIETLAMDICESIKSRHPEVKSVKVRIAKINPPLEARTDRSFVEYELS